MGLITLSGIGSNLDIDSIVTALVNAEGAAKTNSLNRREDQLQTNISGIGLLSSALSDFNDALQNINELTDFSKRAASSSDESLVTVSASSTATPASFSVEVVKVAKGTQLQSTLFGASTDVVGSGTLTITAGSNTFDVVVGATDTLSDIQNNINSAANNFGINVNIINTDTGATLIVDSSITGTANQLVITNDDASLDQLSTIATDPLNLDVLTSTQTADDAEISINGLTVTNDTNVFSSAIEGVSITAVSVPAASTPVDVSVALDTDAAKTAVKDFITAFNALATTRSNLALSNESSVGLLNGNATLRILGRQIDTTVFNTVASATGSIDSLAQLGVNINKDGILEFNETDLNNALETNFNELGTLFAASDGIAVSLEGIVDEYIKPLTGILVTNTTSLGEQLSRVEDERIELADRLLTIETRLRAQFGAMDALVAQLTATGDFLSTQLSNLGNFKDS